MLKNLVLLFSLALAVSSSVLAGATDAERLASVLAAQPEDAQARYTYRHPQETLEFFGIAPGMTVVEALPGGGWYTKILLPYIGQEGRLIGADYSGDMYPLFGFFSEEQLEAKKTWVTDFPADAAEWAGQETAFRLSTPAPPTRSRPASMSSISRNPCSTSPTGQADERSSASTT